MDYTQSVPFPGDIEKAFDYASVVLGTNGFRTTQRQYGVVEFAGPGMYSTRQNPILGATQIRLRAAGDFLELEAVLGGVRAMQRFLTVFPLAMAAGFLLLFGLVMGFAFGQVFGVGFGVPFARGWHWLAFAAPLAVLPLAPWLFLSPVLTRKIRSRTVAALDTLLANIQAAARDA